MPSTPQSLHRLFDLSGRGAMEGNDYRWTIGKGLFGTAANGCAYLATIITNLDPIVRAIMFFGGAIGVILTILSLSLDIRRKIHNWIVERREARMAKPPQPTSKDEEETST